MRVQVTIGAYQLTKNNYYLNQYQKINSYRETDSNAERLVTIEIFGIFEKFQKAILIIGLHSTLEKDLSLIINTEVESVRHSG